MGASETTESGAARDAELPDRKTRGGSATETPLPSAPIIHPHRREIIEMRRTPLAILSAACAAVLGTSVLPGAEPTTEKSTIIGEYDACWIGNTFGGDGGNNGEGYWVQNGADEIEVAPNGLVIAGCDWDEAGRCAGLYKDGKVNRVLLKQEGGPETAWGWNTGNHALTICGGHIYIANLGKRLIRFDGDPDDLDSWEWKKEVELSGEPVGANANEKYLAVAYKDSIELLDVDGLKVVKRWRAKEGTEIQDVLLGPSNDVWMIASGVIYRFSIDSADMKASGAGAFRDVQSPTSIAFDASAKFPTLIVCDNGADHQVKFYDVANHGAPKLVKTFGEKGGLYSKTTVDGKVLAPGVDHPLRFYGLHGAGTDAKGNLYVSLGFNGAPVGGLTLRAFDPDGKLSWELANHAFVDTYGFDRESDGSRVYTRTAVLEINPDSANPDLDWKKVATTIDEARYTKEQDERPGTAATANVIRLQGKLLYYIIGQYGGGYRFFTFDEEHGGQFARPVGKITAEGETWAWYMDTNGDVWHGDFWENKTIQRIRFKGWEKDENAPEGEAIYKPIYDTENPDEWPWPDNFDFPRRLAYVPETDTLYVVGYLKGEEVDSWGVCGKTVRRYDDWTKPTRRIAWTARTPVNPDGENGKPLTPEGFAIAGDYLFFGMVKPDEGLQRTYAMDAKTGEVVGFFVPGGAVGVGAGWQDMPFSVDAIQRKDGSYLVMVEEDWRGKNIIYRWRPDAK